VLMDIKAAKDNDMRHSSIYNNLNLPKVSKDVLPSERDDERIHLALSPPNLSSSGKKPWKPLVRWNAAKFG
jgi:hypothetical protein